MWGQGPNKTAKATAEEQLTFERADGIALAMEMAAHNAETLRCAAGQVGDTTLDKSPSVVHQLQAAANAKAPSRSCCIGKLKQVMMTMTANGVFSLVGGRKNTTSASCAVTRPSWAQV